MGYDFTGLNDILTISKDRVFGFFNEFDEFYRKSLKMKEEYNLANDSNFNIFSSISDTYYKENLHSDIIRLILDPSTKEIGNPENIKLFIDLLNKIRTELKIKPTNKNKIELSDKINVTRERGRIDVLVHDGTNAIIIENKINNAVDGDNQLGNYYKKVSRIMHLPVKAIVYLTLTTKKELDIKKSISNPKEREKITPLIIPVSVIHEKSEISFSDGFINKCKEHSNRNELSRVYYDQYYKLLKSLGGREMGMIQYKSTIKEIYADKEKLSKFMEFGDLWMNKENAIWEIIKELLADDRFIVYPDDYNYMYRKINDTVSLGYALNDNSFGFVRTPGCEIEKFKEQSEILNNCLEDRKINIVFKDNIDLDPTWVYKYVNIDRIGDFGNIINNFHVLEELLK